jgi:hypothetical protein
VFLLKFFSLFLFMRKLDKNFCRNVSNDWDLFHKLLSKNSQETRNCFSLPKSYLEKWRCIIEKIFQLEINKIFFEIRRNYLLKQMCFSCFFCSVDFTLRKNHLPSLSFPEDVLFYRSDVCYYDYVARAGGVLGIAGSVGGSRQSVTGWRHWGKNLFAASSLRRSTS